MTDELETAVVTSNRLCQEVRNFTRLYAESTREQNL